MKVELDLAHFQLGLGTEGGVCSLEKLGIVPARMLGGGKFGSLASLRFSFKTHYPPLPASPAQPVVVRGIVPGYPAAGTQLKTGENRAIICNTCGHFVLASQSLLGNCTVCNESHVLAK